MSNRTVVLTDELYAYLQKESLRETDVMRRLRAETAMSPMGGMQISPEQGQFLALLAQLLGVRRAIEVGVFTGYSSLVVASVLPEGGKLMAFDVNAEWTGIARRYWREAGVANKIDLKLGPAAEGLQGLLVSGGAGQYDYAFIDADKANYDTYYELCLKLLRPGGLIAIDNVLWHGKVADAAASDLDTLALRALNRKLHADERVDMSLVPIGDGVTLARKR